MDEMLFDPANDELPDETEELYRAQYELEQGDELEKKLERDEIRFRKKHQPKLIPEHAQLARMTAVTARERYEDSARTPEAFQTVVAIWDRMDANRERRERYREVLRGDLPLDYRKKYDGAIFPLHYMNPTVQQLSRGNFLDFLFDCPYEMHELTADALISKSLYKLKDEHKELLYFLAIRLYSAARFAELRGQTDRNIRKVRSTVMKKLRKHLYEYLKKRDTRTTREREFIELYEAELDKTKKKTEGQDEKPV